MKSYNNEGNFYPSQAEVSKLLGITKKKSIRINGTSTVCRKDSRFEIILRENLVFVTDSGAKYSIDITKLNGTDRQTLNAKITTFLNNVNDRESFCLYRTPEQRDELKEVMLSSKFEILGEMCDSLSTKKSKVLLELFNTFEYDKFEVKEVSWKFQKKSLEDGSECLFKFKK